MLIKNKFKIGQIVWFIDKNQVKSGEVESLTFYISKRVNYIEYGVSDYKDDFGRNLLPEHLLFASKDDLKKSL